jgi:tetratricopeptide (TPR) repeat protein
VSALFAWCKFVSDKPEAKDRLDELLDLIEERFLPSSIALLDMRHDRASAVENGARPPRRRLRRRAPRSAEDYRRKIDEVVDGWLASEGYPFMALTWLDPASDGTGPRFRQVAERPDLSPYLYHWLGRQLLARWRASQDGRAPDEEAREGALVAFERAEEIEQPDVLLELADALRELDRPEQSERVYSKAAGSSPEARQLTMVAERFEELGDFEGVLDLYKRAQAHEPEEDEERLHDEAYYGAAVGSALFGLKRFAEARAALDAVPDSGGELGPIWRVRVIQRLLATHGIDDRETHLRLREWLAAAQRGAIGRGDGIAAMDAANAALELAHDGQTRVLWRPLDEETAFKLRSPVPLPIVVEAHAGFFPQEGDTPVVARMIDQDIPVIRGAIQRETGVWFPAFASAAASISNPAATAFCSMRSRSGAASFPSARRTRMSSCSRVRTRPSGLDCPPSSIGTRSRQLSSNGRGRKTPRSGV